MNPPLVSLVVSTYNEAKNIGSLLNSCLNQTYKNTEIIVVDSLRTTDKTAAIAQKYKVKVFVNGTERSEQRDFGVRNATGKYTLILDADMKLDPNVVSACVTVVTQNPDIKSVVIPEKSFGENYWAKCKALERNCYINDPSIEAARFFDRKQFLKLGGYDPKMISGEDWDLHRRFKEVGKIGRINKFIFHNEDQINLWRDVKKKFYYSQKSDHYLTHNITSVRDIILFIFRPAYFRNWNILLSDPVHLPGFMLMKLMELFMGGLVIVQKPVFWKSFLKKQ